MAKRQLSIAALCLLCIVVACSTKGQQMLVPGIEPAAVSQTVRFITLTPPSLTIPGIGKTNAKTVIVAEKRYTGSFTEKSACKGIANANPLSGKGPSFKVTITGLSGATCSITFSDTKHHSARLPITVATPIPAKYHIVHDFSASDGRYPSADLTSLNGTLYGTTQGGGTQGSGSVFSLTPSGIEKVLHNFGPFGGSDGATPFAGLVNVNGIFYGTTFQGGTGGNGTVFSITTSGTEKVLHTFTGGSDGRHPTGNLVALNGVLYGTTQYGGTSDAGTVFSITTSGMETVLHTFGTNGNDGSYPIPGLTLLNGTLYGTTSLGGTYNPGGTVFEINTSGTEAVLHAFKGGSDGYQPNGGLVALNGVLYGTTTLGGGGGTCSYGGCGTVFSITTGGTESVIHAFAGGSDGSTPVSDLAAVNGTLYGTTQVGGASNFGVVFSVTPSGTEKVLHAFTGGSDGHEPLAGLYYLSGFLYGTTKYGGVNGVGDVFALPPA